MNVGKQKIALGCYTDEANPNGLKVLELDEGSGAMSVVAERPVSNALYQALSPDGKYIYSCTGEGLASFRAEGQEPVDSISLGNCVCHVSAMPDGKRVAFADYLGGFAGSVEVADGRFGQAVRHQHSGCGPNLPRQDKAHCHQAIPVPGGKGYCVVDLGLGLDVPVRGDHVPEMAYDRVLTPEGTPGYFTLGRLFANGYLKALLKSIA